MTETELFKIVVNNGFMALFVVWVLFKGEPRYREMIVTMEATHKSTIDKLTGDHKQMMETVVRSHETVVAAMQKECREERREIMAAIKQDAELNREARHDFANTLQRAIGEIYQGHAADRSGKP